ncbi:hypothetical protein FSP39_019813 [Pinctada imbricata]|uniref:Calponin-homology (CH) domain-containing protein n=1 Tax=Pinctada imbricata TaxID=66713 RepID=A0AA88XMA4_PINIB|nr:hypothetical protein FSP39_019813 [Pinctada imbricata]
MDSQNVDAVWEMISGNLGSEENRATSTPNGDIQRKNRKSWFEKRKDSKFEIAIEKKTRRRSGKRKSEEEVETLLLTHFTNPPKIEFGKSKIGLKKSRTLRIKNPHEYPQTVKVERFPFKKNFSIDCDEVVVDAESTVLVTVEWCPENDGSFREMILFIVDNAYRLQAFVIGRCETPAEKKKLKGGLLGRRVKRPFSVVQTSNFANIAKSYSPQKETKKRKSVNRLIPAQDVSEGHTKEARISDGFIPPMVIPVEPDEQDENKNLGIENENSGKSGHRRSSTYRVPYIDVSPIKTVPDITPMKHEKKLVTVNTDDVPQKTTNSTECMPKTPSSTVCPVTTRTFVSPNSFLHDSLLSCKGTETQPAHSTVLPTPERCLVKEEPRSFVSPNSFNQAVNRVKKDVKPVQGKQSRTNSTRPLSRKDTVVKSSNIRTNVKDARASKPSTQSEKASKPAASGVKRSKFSLPQSKLVLTKKSKTALPKHPMPFASKNMYYDERWMEKQERGFTHWLNFLLTPTEEYQLSYNKTKVDAGKLFMETPSSKALLAPTKEVLSFRAYAATRRLNQLRRSACKLFQSDSVVHVIQKIEAEIDSQRLLIRKDRMVHADLGLKQGILDMLLSFNPLWLRIGLETIYGEIIPIQRNDDVYGLSRFIVTRLLGSPDIAQEYAHPTVPHLYKDGYAAAIARHTLKKFLLLVYFLDHAKTKHLINHDPCLFCKDSEYKNCKAMLVEFSRCYLAGEGDVTRHLGYLGYIVTHTQVPLDEFEYAVNNIATDLRDGVRLTKVVELLSSKIGLTKKLRAPAISRLQKVHNMEVVFNVLKEHGIDFTKHTSPIMPRDIVDGHRERTLRFLWTLILQYQVSVLLSEEQLKEEIEILQKSLKVRNQLSALQRYEQGLKGKRRESAEPELHTKSKILGLVLKWCRVVCAFYNIKIENFTVSFGDGRALCYLVHHYHPSLLPREAIKTRTMMSYHTESEQNNIGDSSLSESPEPFIVNEDPKLYEELLANEKENFKLLYEKVVVTYVTYLCARLLDIRHESRAARIIQLAWRRYVLRKSQRELEIKVKAAIVLQRAFRSYHARMIEVRRSSAAITIQSYWRRAQAIRKLRQLQWERDHHTQVMAANVIKHHLRGWCKRRQYQRLVRSTVLIQSLVRRYLTLKNLRKRHQAATAIQTYYLGYKLTRQTRREFSETRQAVCMIQRWYRDRLTERQAAREKAAVTVQAWWRMVVCRKVFIKRRTCAIVIQEHVRGFFCRQCFQRKKRAACYIQQKVRGMMEMRRERHGYMKLYKSCLFIQRKWRIFHQQKKALMIQSATRIQSWYRGCVTRKQYQQYRRAAIKIQGSIRGYLIRKQYRALQKATILVQHRYRAVRKMREVKSEYRDLRRGTVIAQSLWRGKTCRDSFIKQRKAAIIIQSYCRGQQQRKIYKQVMSQRDKAALTLQTFYRGMKQRRVFLVQKQAAVILQKRCRGYLARRWYKEMKQAATVLQIKWRERAKVQRARNTFLTQKRAALVLQSHVRKFLVMRQYRRLKRSAIYSQSLIRMKKVKKEYQAKRNAAVILQSRFRAVREGKKRRWQFLIKKGAAITIQMFYRAFKVRQCSSAIRIQANVRRFLAQTKFKRLKTAALTCQRLFRAKREMENCVECYRKVQDSVKSIQSWWRGVRCRRKYVQMKSAAILLQSRFRGIKQLRMYQMQKSSALVLQRHVRALIASERERRMYLQLRAACVCIQARWRGTKQRRKYRGIVNNVIKAQSYVRRFLVQNRYQKLKKATVTIQQRYRRSFS